MSTNRLFRWFIRSIVIATVVFSGFVGSIGTSFAADNSGAVYTMTNATTGNQVLIFNRAADGSLLPAGAVSTGGNGNGPVIGLHSQYSIVLGQGNRWLFVVNAGSNSISSLRVSPSGLTLVDTQPSEGNLPVSIAVHGHLLYVLNQGSDTIAGFRIGLNGRLRSIPGSVRALSNTNAAAAQISFSPEGETLVVTEKNTKTIDTFNVEDEGRIGQAVAYPSNGNVPYGFDFDRRGRIFVSEAGSVAASSYNVSETGVLTSISASVPTTGNAPCWLVVTDNGKYAFVTNAASGTVSRFSIAKDGSISLLGTTAALGRGVTDEALSSNSQYLYALMGGSGDIDAFSVQSDGSLTAISGASGLPTGTVGLASW
jgi:6-phosphogluconolactonase (cycloisomerase 2 family)